MTTREINIEKEVERRTDAVDARYLRGDLDEAGYHFAMKEIEIWAVRQYDLANGGRD